MTRISLMMLIISIVIFILLSQLLDLPTISPGRFYLVVSGVYVILLAIRILSKHPKNNQAMLKTNGHHRRSTEVGFITVSG